MTVLRHLHRATGEVGQALEKLGSGLRVNRAADDAAGLSVSQGLRLRRQATDQAARNAADGIGLVQTADGSLQELADILARMKSLTVQSHSGILSPQDQRTLRLDYRQMQAEIGRVVAATEFNGLKLLDGSGGRVPIQVGPGTTARDRIEIDLSARVQMPPAPLPPAPPAADWADRAAREIDSTLDFILDLRARWGAVQNRLEGAVRHLGVTAENLTAADSRIRDVDVAAAAARLAGRQVLQQAGVAVLSQSRLTAGLALQLL